MRIKLVIMSVSVCLLVPLSLAAQEAASRNEWVQGNPATRPVNKASDASFDKRLPPVLPGEVVGDSGKKMKVWSTSGPVPVAEAPEPWSTPAAHNHGVGTLNDSGVSVILDERNPVRAGQNQ